MTSPENFDTPRARFHAVLCLTKGSASFGVLESRTGQFAGFGLDREAAERACTQAEINPDTFDQYVKRSLRENEQVYFIPAQAPADLLDPDFEQFTYSDVTGDSITIGTTSQPDLGRLSLAEDSVNYVIFNQKEAVKVAAAVLYSTGMTREEMARLEFPSNLELLQDGGRA